VQMLSRDSVAGVECEMNGSSCSGTGAMSIFSPMMTQK
jgi:hypothetical protein